MHDATRHIIGVLWGTSRAQFLLIRYGSAGAWTAQVADRRDGPGASQVRRADYRDVLDQAIASWREEYPDAPIMLAGMVGSTIGWQDIPYAVCPLRPNALADVRNVDDQRLHFVSGLVCRHDDGTEDILRGEETEIAGWLAADDSHRVGAHLVCIPGTHVKWVRITDGQIADFSTSITGEIFAGLRQNGVIVSRSAETHPSPTAAFNAGVALALQSTQSILRTAFQARVKRVRNGMGDSDAVETLSGLLIGSDVHDALPLARAAGGSVAVIGSEQTATRYARALKMANVRTKTWPSERCAAMGFAQILGTMEVGS